MSTPTPTPQNTPSAPFELPCAEFDEPVKAAPESPTPRASRCQKASVRGARGRGLLCARAPGSARAASATRCRARLAPASQRASTQESQRHCALADRSQESARTPRTSREPPSDPRQAHAGHARVCRAACTRRGASVHNSIGAVAPAEGATEPEQHRIEATRWGRTVRRRAVLTLKRHAACWTIV